MKIPFLVCVWLLASVPLQAEILPNTPNNSMTWRLNAGTANDNGYDQDPATGYIWVHDNHENKYLGWGYREHGVSTAATFASSPSGTDITGTDTDFVYQTHRYAPQAQFNRLDYFINVPNGDYLIRLLFSETSDYVSGPGERVFGVSVEEDTIIPALDIFEQAQGKFKSFDIAIDKHISDSRFDVSLSSAALDPMLSGIELTAKNISDDSFLDFIQKTMFYYFNNHAGTNTGLVPIRLHNFKNEQNTHHDADPSDLGDEAGLAVTGLSLSVFTVGAKRGWISLDTAHQKVKRTLEWFIHNAPQINGFYYDRMHRDTGAPWTNARVSREDTVILLLSALQAGEFFRIHSSLIADLAQQMYQAMSWANQDLSQEPGLAHYPNGFLYALMAGEAPHQPDTNHLFHILEKKWIAQKGTNIIHQACVWPHIVNHLFFDLRGFHDQYGVDYIENTRRVLALNKQICREDPDGRYSDKLWGLSRTTNENKTYQAHGIDLPLDGSVDPHMAYAALPFLNEQALAAAQHMFFQYKHAVWGVHGLPDGVNVTTGQVSPFSDGLDLAVALLSIENHRSEFLRHSFMKNTYAQNIRTKMFTQKTAGHTASSMIFPADNAFDNDPATYWESIPGNDQWLQKDLGTVQTLSGVSIQWGSAFGRMYRIDVSLDGENWQEVACEHNGNGGLDTLYFSSVPARHVRFYGQERTSLEDGYQIQEFRAPISAPLAEQKILMYPNPYHPSQGRRLTFSLLQPGADIRIYDFSGALIQQLFANATGTAVWNGCNRANNLAASGVYLVHIKGFPAHKPFKLIIER